MVKIVKFLIRIIFEHLLKAMFLMFETETVGPCLVRNLKWGGGTRPPWPPLHPSGYAPDIKRFARFGIV